MTASFQPHDPVVVGVGQFLQRDADVLDDPITLAAEAARRAAADAGAPGILSRLDAIATVPIVSWRYGDPGVLIAEALGAQPSLTMHPLVGGNTPQMLMNRICDRISNGELDIALLCGAEAYRSRMKTRRAGEPLDWPRQDLSIEPGWTDGTSYDMGHPAELALGIMMPTQVYPLFEIALRHESGRTADEHTRFIAEIWARYSDVAARNPNAWNQTAYTADEIATVTPTNRIVGYPYTKHMVSNPDVDMASAAIICSAQTAVDLGIDRDQWVFVHSGADGKDRHVSTRASLTTSPAIRHAGAAALELAHRPVDEIEHLDVYSCFPSAVEIACSELGISTDRQLTVYGGLCFAGGPWNNPVGHAIAAMVETLRSDPGSTGLVTANGGNIQKHSFGVYSTRPPADGFRSASPQFAIDADLSVDVDETYLGPATVESWTVMHDRDGSRGRGHALLRTPAGARVWATTEDPTLTEVMETVDLVGADAVVAEESAFRLG